LEAHMEGYEVTTMEKAAGKGDIFITTTGNRDVIVEDHFKEMKDGAVLANAGHFDVEIDLDALEDMADERLKPRDGIESYILSDGRRLNVLAEGRLVNLASPVAMGHPVEVMDQSFGVQAACVVELTRTDYDEGVHKVPDHIDEYVAETKLEAEGIEFDELTETQEQYLSSWKHGT
ncbi:MAG: adenosylhomocysteinase, partial [Halobacteriaceae archaeon]